MQSSGPLAQVAVELSVVSLEWGSRLTRNVFVCNVCKLLVAVLCWWRWEYSTSGGCVTLVVVVELSVVSLGLGQTYTEVNLQPWT
jgi:hypothetical protein